MHAATGTARESTLEQCPEISEVTSYKIFSVFLNSIDSLCSTLRSQLCDGTAVCGRGLPVLKKNVYSLGSTDYCDTFLYTGCICIHICILDEV